MLKYNLKLIILHCTWAAPVLILAGWLVVAPLSPAQAAPNLQIQIFTPTPGPDGRIIYIVKASDTLISISLISGVSVEKLRELNNISGDAIYEGQKLLLGRAGPPEVTNTPGPSPTPTSILPTPTPKPGSGTLCVILFNDLNGDSTRQESEPAIPDGAISISNRAGTVSKTANTTTSADPLCFEKSPEGDYTISVAVPAGYNPTTVNSIGLELKAGDETYVDFGAQANAQTQAEAPTPSSSGRSPLLGIIGGLFLLAGVGLALFAGRMLRGKSASHLPQR